MGCGILPGARRLCCKLNLDYLVKCFSISDCLDAGRSTSDKPYGMAMPIHALVQAMTATLV